MVNKFAILTSAIFASELLPKLLSEKIYPEIFTYKNELHRKSLYTDLDNYSSFFNITYIATNRYSQNENLFNKNNFSHIIAIDWNKDFFDKTTDQVVIFMQPSLLPMYRGYGAISEQFLNGVCIGGITFYLPNDIVDAGDIVYQREIEIGFEDYPEDYIRKLCEETVQFIHYIKENQVTRTPQNENYAFSLSRIRRKDGLINFRSDSLSIYNKIRAYSKPYFGAFCFMYNQKINVFRGKPEKWQGIYGKSGEIINIDKNGVEVACGSGTILLQEIELPDSIKLSKGEIFNS